MSEDNEKLQGLNSCLLSCFLLLCRELHVRIRLLIVLGMTVATVAHGADAPRKIWVIEDGRIPDDLSEIMQDIIDSMYVFDAETQHAPPWQRYPGYPQSSMAWRMGGGEDYIRGFRAWYKALSEQDRKDYRLRYPAPPGWERFYDDAW